YALGILLYELLTAAVPFAGPATEVERRHRDEDPDPPSRLAPPDAPVSEELDEAVLSLLRKVPEARPRASELAPLFEPFAIGDEPTVAGTTAAPQTGMMTNAVK